MPIFWLILSIFWNVENTLPIFLKHSKFCSFMKTISLKKKKACFGYFSIWTKIAVCGPYRCGHFLVDFEYFWNVGNTLPIFLQHSKFCSFIRTISLKRKKHVFGTFQFSEKSLCPDLTGVAFFWLILGIFWNVENTLPILLKHSKFCSFIQIQFEEKKACFWEFSIFGEIAVYGSYRRGLFLIDFEYFFICWKYPSNSCETFKILFQFFWNMLKILFFHENNQFEEKKGMFWGHFNLDQNRCIRTLPAWPFFGWFWVFFEMLKIPFQFFWNIQNFVLSRKQSVWRKKSMFLGLLNFRQNRCVRTLTAWPFFGWFWVFFEMLKIHFQFLWNIKNFVLSFKFSLKKKKHVFGTFQFSAKSLYPDLTGVAFFWLILSIFLYVENTLPILVKHSKFCSNSSETFKILFFHENNQFEEKKGMFWGHFNLDQNRCIRT